MTEKNDLIFIKDKDKEKFNLTGRWVDRKIQLESSTSREEKEICTFLSDDYNKLGGNFRATWIECQKYDGVSWLAEKIRLIFQRKKKSLPSLEVIALKGKGYKVDELPLIAGLIGDEVFCKCALKAKLISPQYNSLSLASISGLFATVVLSVASIIFTLVLNYDKLNTIISKVWKIESILPIQLFIILIVFIIAVAILKTILDKHNEKYARNKGLKETLEKIKTKEDEEVEYTKYDIFIKLIGDKIKSLSFPRVVIIDEFSCLDPISIDVLIGYFNRGIDNKIGGKEYWILLDTNPIKELAVEKSIKENYFTFSRLLPIDDEDKQKVFELFNLPEENRYEREIKWFFQEEIDANVQKKILKDLEDFKKNTGNPNDSYSTLDFLYLLSVNSKKNRPAISKNTLIEKITQDNEPRKTYIHFILKNITLSMKEIREQFDIAENRFKEYFIAEKIITIPQNVIYCFLENFHKLNLVSPRFCQGYWGFFWYDYLQNKKLSIPSIKKLSYHLKESDTISERYDILANLFEAHLFALERSILLFLKEEAVGLIKNIYELGIQKDDIKQELLKLPNLKMNYAYEKLQRLIFSAFFNFQFKFDENDFELEKMDNNLYNLIHAKKKNNLNAELKSKFSDEFLFHILNEYWNRILLSRLSGNFVLKNIDNDLENFQTMIEEVKPTKINLDGSRTDLSVILGASLKVHNIGIYVWTQTLKTYNKFSREKIIKSVLEQQGQSNIELTHSIQQIDEAVRLFVDFHEKIISKIQLDKRIEYSLLFATMQETGLIIYSAILLFYYKYSHSFNDNEVQVIRKICDIRVILSDDKNNKEEVLSEMMSLTLAQSLIWEKMELNYRSYVLKIIRIHLYSIIKSTIDNKNVIVPEYNFESELKDLLYDKNYYISTIANLTLCNYYTNYSLQQASFHFQNACRYFIADSQITPLQLDSVFLLLTKYNINNNEYVIEMGLKKLAYNVNVDDYFKSNLSKIDGCYLQILNCLRKANDFDEKPIIEFLENKLEIIEDVEVRIEAESYLKNYKFGKLSKKQRREEKDDFKNYWSDKKKILTYSVALGYLFDLEKPNPTEETETEICNLLSDFLSKNEQPNYSGYFNLANNFCSYYERNPKKIQKPLEFLADNVEVWESLLDVDFIDSVYEKLIEFDDEKYQEGFLRIRQMKIEMLCANTRQAFVNNDYFVAFEYVYDTWDKYIEDNYNSISIKEYNETLRLNQEDKKIYLLTHNDNLAPPLVCDSNSGEDGVNLQFILFGKILTEFGNDLPPDLIEIKNKINQESHRYYDSLIKLIFESPRIRRLSKVFRNRMAKLYDYDLHEEEAE